MPMPANGFTVTLTYGNGDIARASCQTFTIMQKIDRKWRELQAQDTEGYKWTITCGAAQASRKQ